MAHPDGLDIELLVEFLFSFGTSSGTFFYGFSCVSSGTRNILEILIKGAFE